MLFSYGGQAHHRARSDVCSGQPTAESLLWGFGYRLWVQGVWVFFWLAAGGKGGGSGVVVVSGLELKFQVLGFCRGPSDYTTVAGVLCIMTA